MTMQINDSSSENPKFCAVQISDELARQKEQEQKRLEAVKVEILSIVRYQTVERRVWLDDEPAFTYDEASRLIPLWQELPFNTKLAFWELYNLPCIAYYLIHSRQIFGVAGGRLNTLFNDQDAQLLDIIPRDDYELELFINWCMSRYTLGGKVLSILTKEDYVGQILKDNDPEEYLQLTIDEVEQVIRVNEHVAQGTNVNGYGDRIFHKEQYRSWLFAEGLNDFKRNNIRILSKMKLDLSCLVISDLESMSSIFWGYYDGKHAGEMRVFLKLQKKRSDAGEDLKVINASMHEINESEIFKSSDGKSELDATEKSSKGQNLPKLNIPLEGYREIKGIAMLYGYLGIHLTDEEANLVGTLCGRKGGQGLTQNIKRYYMSSKRICFNSGGEKEFDYQLNRFDWVIQKLSEMGQDKIMKVAMQEKDRYIANYNEGIIIK